MAGIINQAQAPAQPQAQGAPLALTPEAAQKNTKLDPKLQDVYKRLCVAGMKVLFDPTTHKMILQQLNGPQPLGVKIGTGIANLVVHLWNIAKGALPGQVIIPVGTYLIAQVGDYLQKTGMQPVTDQDIAQALKVFMAKIMQLYHVNPADPAHQQPAQQQPPAQPAAAPAAPPAAPDQTQPQPGA